MSLDLDADPAPGVPLSATWNRSSVVVPARIPRPLALWMRRQATYDGLSVSSWLQRLVRREMERPRWPADVEDWLTAQAVQMGCEPDEVVPALVRHLAERYPDGARLR